MDDTTKTATEEITTPEQIGADDENKIVFTQEKLNSLIDNKYKKGAEAGRQQLLEDLGVENVNTIKEVVQRAKEIEESQKTETQKIQEKIEAQAKENINLKSKLEEFETDNKISNLAIRNNIKELDYFKFLYKQENSKEGFNEDNFISSLLENKGELLTGSRSPINIPNPPNNRQDAGSITRAEFQAKRSIDQMKLVKSGIKIID